MLIRVFRIIRQSQVDEEINSAADWPCEEPWYKYHIHIKSNHRPTAYNKSMVHFLKWFALRGPELTQMIRALRSRTDSNDSRFALRGPELTQMIRDSRSAVPIWLKWFALRGPELTQMIRDSRSRADSNDSRSAVPIWLKWFALCGPELTQMIHVPRSRTDSNDSRSAVPNWLKWFALRGPELTQMIQAPRSRTDSNDSRFALPIWLKWFALRGPELTQMTRATIELNMQNINAISSLPLRRPVHVTAWGSCVEDQSQCCQVRGHPASFSCYSNTVAMGCFSGLWLETTKIEILHVLIRFVFTTSSMTLAGLR